MNVITAASHANHLTGICLSASSLGYDTGLVLKGIDTLSESLTGNEELVVESLYDGLSRGVWRPLDNSGMNTNKIRLSYEAYNRNDPGNSGDNFHRAVFAELISLGIRG